MEINFPAQSRYDTEVSCARVVTFVVLCPRMLKKASQAENDINFVVEITVVKLVYHILLSSDFKVKLPSATASSVFVL